MLYAKIVRQKKVGVAAVEIIFEEMVITCTHAQLSLNLRVIEALQQHEIEILDELLQKMYRIVCRSGLRFYCDNRNRIAR